MQEFDTSAFLRLQLERIQALAPDIKITYGERDLDIISDEVSFSADGAVAHFGFAKVARFSVKKDLSHAEIQLASAQEKSPKIKVATHALLLSILHAVRGDLTFHGNSLAFKSTSYAVFGGSGAGKSTLTLFALLNGHRLIGDDAVVIRENNLLTGGRPFLHLTKETANHLLPNEVLFEPKEYRLLSHLGLEPALARAEPLSRIYLLESGDSIDIQPCNNLPETLFVMLNSSRMMATLVKFDPAIVDRLLRFLEVTSVRKLIYPRSYSKLPDVLAKLENDLIA